MMNSMAGAPDQRNPVPGGQAPAPDIGKAVDALVALAVASLDMALQVEQKAPNTDLQKAKSISSAKKTLDSIADPQMVKQMEQELQKNIQGGGGQPPQGQPPQGQAPQGQPQGQPKNLEGAMA